MGGESLVVGQTDHSRLVGQLAAHWENAEVARKISRERSFSSAMARNSAEEGGWLGMDMGRPSARKRVKIMCGLGDRKATFRGTHFASLRLRETRSARAVAFP